MDWSSLISPDGSGFELDLSRCAGLIVEPFGALISRAERSCWATRLKEHTLHGLGGLAYLYGKAWGYLWPVTVCRKRPLVA